MRMYVGNLDFQTTDEDLLKAFRAYGAVLNANVMTNAQTGHARGFGFVEMKDEVQAQAALAGLEGSELRGRPLTVRQEKSIRHESSPTLRRGNPR